MVRRTFALALLCLCAGTLYAESNSSQATAAAIPAKITLPSVNAKITLGFSYDLLRSPTDVSSDYAKGFIGFNIPYDNAVNPLEVVSNFTDALDTVFADSTMFANGDKFKPSVGFKQNANTTVRVDVPMLGGVGSFSTIQNFYINYSTVLGNGNLSIKPDSLAPGVDLFLKGALNVPITTSLSWETMSFGYAYKVNKLLMLAFNLNRHVFELDLQSRIDANIYGFFAINKPEVQLTLRKNIDYNSTQVYGNASGHYRAEAWTPTIGIKFWRLAWTSRFGLETEAKGTFAASYSLPFFIDKKTFQQSVDLTKTETLMDAAVRDRLLRSEVDSVSYFSRTSATWTLPQAHTIAFDIIPEGLTVSYTKLFGAISARHIYEGDDGIPGNSDDRKDLDVEIKVDHVIMLNANLYGAFLNAGVFGLDISLPDNKNILGTVYKDAGISMVMLDNMPLLPVLNIGSSVGTKIKLLLELDILPLPALRTGVSYYF